MEYINTQSDYDKVVSDLAHDAVNWARNESSNSDVYVDEMDAIYDAIDYIVNDCQYVIYNRYYFPLMQFSSDSESAFLDMYSGHTLRELMEDGLSGLYRAVAYCGLFVDVQEKSLKILDSKDVEAA